MIFSSVEFLLFFLPIFLILYALSPSKMKNEVLLSGSLIFYALGEPEYLMLLMVSVLINYFLGLHLGNRGRKMTVLDKTAFTLDKNENEDKNGKGNGVNNKKHKKSKAEIKRKKIFVAAILFNVGILAAFKYIGKEGLPLGISFYTFQILSYLIDVYKGRQEKETSFVNFATYITMFPQLLSGPIVSYSEVRPALYGREYTIKGIQDGLKVFTMGLAAKVLLADRLDFLWREVQITGFESISTPLAWLAAVAYSMKIYFDFCGYSLMATGLGRMLGFELPANFKNPYMADSVRDFYRRWHITLGRWFRWYIYIPLGGNRKGEFRTVCNLLAVWLLTAFWHGSTANFLIWGMLLWLAIVIERQLEALGLFRFLKKGCGRLISHLYIWTVIPITWMCFAISDVEELQIYLGRMFNVIPGMRMSVMDWRNALSNYGLLLGIGALACTPCVQKLFRRFKDTWLGMILLAALFWLCVWRLQVEGNNPFMYLRF